MKSEFVREEAVFAAQHFCLTLNYEAVHREAFEIVAIRNSPRRWGYGQAAIRTPLPPLPSSSSADWPCHAWLSWTLRCCSVLHRWAVMLKVRACKGWSRPQGWRYFPLLKTCQLSFNITEYHVTNIKATWQWECLFSYWSRLEHKQSFHLLLAIVKRRLYWPILTLSQGGDYIS